jgi:hypothetical protein
VRSPRCATRSLRVAKTIEANASSSTSDQRIGRAHRHCSGSDAVRWVVRGRSASWSEAIRPIRRRDSLGARSDRADAEFRIDGERLANGAGAGTGPCTVTPSQPRGSYRRATDSVPRPGWRECASDWPASDWAGCVVLGLDVCEVDRDGLLRTAFLLLGKVDQGARLPCPTARRPAMEESPARSSPKL